VQMLLRSEPDLIDRTDPMIFPVFGRGRALLPLIGAGITADNIHSSASFLVGACSCEVKELNPGFDLLLAADWDELLSVDGQPLPIVPTRKEPTGEVELVPIPQGSAAAPVVATTLTNAPAPAERPSGNASSTRGSAVYTLIAIAAAFVVVVALAGMFSGKQNPTQ